MSKKTRETEQLTIEGTSETEILARLAERVERAVALIAQLRKENEELGTRVDTLEGELKDAVAARDAAAARARDAEERVAEIESDGSTRLEELERQVETLTDERKAVRGRVESILERLEGLEEDSD